MRAISGVYGIVHRSGRIYVGSSWHIRRRWIEHVGDLRRGCHVNTALQSLWKSDGETAFEWVILDTCPLRRLKPCEQSWIDQVGRPWRLNSNAVAVGTSGPRPWAGRKIAAALRGRPHSRERRLAISRGRIAARTVRGGALTEAQKRHLVALHAKLRREGPAPHFVMFWKGRKQSRQHVLRRVESRYRGAAA